MTLGISAYLGNKLLDLSFRGTAFAGSSTPFVQLHIGDPGGAGTSNAATETTRKAVTFAAAASASIANSAQVSWTGIAGSQDASHFSLWDASTAGNFLGSGLITANAYTAGDNYIIGIGALTVSFTLAA